MLLPLRFLFATESVALTAVLGIVYRAIATHLIRKAGLTQVTAQAGVSPPETRLAGASCRPQDGIHSGAFLPMRHSVDYLYSLYDALVSIHVPNDKARAVVDAMERDMGTTLATKSDLDQLRSELRQELALVRKDFEMLANGLRMEMDTLAAGIRQDQQTLGVSFRRDQEVLSAAFRKDLELLSTGMTVRLGSMLIVGLGVLFAALKLT